MKAHGPSYRQPDAELTEALAREVEAARANAQLDERATMTALQRRPGMRVARVLFGIASLMIAPPVCAFGGAAIARAGTFDALDGGALGFFVGVVVGVFGLVHFIVGGRVRPAQPAITASSGIR